MVTYEENNNIGSILRGGGGLDFITVTMIRYMNMYELLS